MLSFYDKAFLATYYALDKMYKKYPSDSLVILVGDMCPFTFADLKSADPAAYHDFVKCCKQVEAQGGQEDEINTAFQCALAYLQFFNDEFAFPLMEEKERFSMEDFKAAWQWAEETGLPLLQQRCPE